METESLDQTRYRDLFENLPVGILRTRPDGQIIDANPALVKMLGYPDKLSLLARHAADLYVHPEEFDKWMAESDRDSDVHVSEAQARRHDGNRVWVQRSVRAVRDGQGQVLYYDGAMVDFSERLRTEAALSDKVATLQALAEIGREIIAAHEPQSILDLVCRRAAQLIRVPKSIITTRLPSGESRLAASYGIVQPEEATLEFMRRSQAGWFRESKLDAGPFMRDDLESEPALMPGFRASNKLRAFAAAALTVDQQLLGALIVLDTAPHRWNSDEMQILTLLASQTAIALDKLNLYKEAHTRAEQMALLYDSGLTLSRVFDPQEQLRVLTTIAMKALHAERVEFARYDKTRDELQIEMNSGYNESILPELQRLRFHLSDERGVIGRVAQSRAPLYLPDVSASAHWIVVDPAIRSGFWAPIEHEAQLYGVLGVLSTRADAFDPLDERLLTLFASQAGAALASARLLEDARSRTLYLATLNEIGQAITSSLDLNQVLATLLDTVRKATHAEACSVALIEPETGEMVFRQAVSDAPSNVVGQRLKPGQGIAGWVAEHGQTALVADATSDPRFVPNVDSSIGFITRDLVCAPLIAGSQVIGVVELINKSGGAFTPEDAWLLESVATQAAVAIDHARLFEETRRRLGELRIVSEAALAGAAGRTFDEAVARASAGLGQWWPDANVAFLFLDEKGQTLHVHPAAYNVPAEVINSTKIRLGQGVTGWVAQERQPIRIGDVTTDPRYIVGAPGVRAEMAAPLVAGERILGVVNVASPYLNAFSEDDLRLLITLAGQLTVIFEKARLDAALETERALLAHRVQERTAELSAANAELARAARAKDEFLASMSHELRTPLNAVLGLSEALQEQVYGPQNEKQLKALRSITESGRHLLDLINDILDLSKIEAGKLTLQIGPTDVEPICQASLRFIKETASRKQIQVVFKLDPAVKTIQADSRRLKQILVNLLSNAVKFTPAGGSVGLQVTGLPESQAIHFAVWDTGIGIAQADMPRLFQPFVQLNSRLDRQYSGTGLGLSLVSRMTELHGGGILVESEAGRGSRFTIALPWRPVSGPPSSATGADITADQLEGKLQKALVVDNSHASAEQTAHALADLGIASTIHSQGLDIVEQAIQSAPDVIFLEVLLADVSGWSVMAQLKAEPRTRDIPIVLTSLTGERARGLALGAAGCLTKPVTREQLYVALHQIVSERVNANPNVITPLILLAEDSESNITTMSDYLQSKGFRIVVARNGIEAIERARERNPDLILMDVQMPQMDGLAATRRIRAVPRLANVPIIALTALAMPGDRERCLEAGANDQLTKPVGLREMVRAIQAHLAASQHKES